MEWNSLEAIQAMVKRLNAYDPEILHPSNWSIRAAAASLIHQIVCKNSIVEDPEYPGTYLADERNL